MNEEDKTSEEQKSNEQKLPLKENLYDRIPLTLKQLDIIIAILLVALVVFFTIGVLKGNGVL